MFARLLQIHAITRTIERYFPLLAATLRTNPSMHGRAKAFFLAFFADRTTHKIQFSSVIIPRCRHLEASHCHERRERFRTRLGDFSQSQSLLDRTRDIPESPKNVIFVGFSGSLFTKPA